MSYRKPPNITQHEKAFWATIILTYTFNYRKSNLIGLFS